jgi:ABC-type polysaccharide/polyol phosphate export permease
MLQTRTDVKAAPCTRCRIIRSFIMFVVMLVLLAIVGGEKLAHFNILTPAFFAAVIIGVGILGFIVKLVHWKLFSKPASNAD